MLPLTEVYETKTCKVFISRSRLKQKEMGSGREKLKIAKFVRSYFTSASEKYETIYYCYYRNETIAIDTFPPYNGS